MTIRTLLVAAAMTQSTALAQNGDSAIQYEKITEIEFGAQSISAPIAAPDHTLITETPRPRFNPLIRIRVDFDDLSDTTVREVK
jgi:hypothetical protein